MLLLLVQCLGSPGRESRGSGYWMLECFQSWTATTKRIDVTHSLSKVWAGAAQQTRGLLHCHDRRVGSLQHCERARAVPGRVWHRGLAPAHHRHPGLLCRRRRILPHFYPGGPSSSIPYYSYLPVKESR